jgi:hypothetical protein
MLTEATIPEGHAPDGSFRRHKNIGRGASWVPAFAGRHWCPLTFRFSDLVKQHATPRGAGNDVQAK